MSTKFVILDNVRSAHNVGSIFRTADGAGVEKIFLIGVTPCPIDRFGRKQPEIMKTSLGAAETVPWEHKSDDEALELIRQLQSGDVTVVAIEQTPSSISLDQFQVPNKVAYVFGNEIAGVQPALIDASDKVVEIRMKGKKESLNVSVTAGIILFKNG